MESLKKILPESIITALKNVDYERLIELRIRADSGVIVNYNGKKYFLSQSGLTGVKNSAILASKRDVENIVMRATNNSVYAHINHIIEGYIPYENGIRIGVVGECVYENGIMKSVKNFSSLNIRIAHEIKNAAKDIMPYLFVESEFQNTLIFGAPNTGKTTKLRDIVQNLAKENYPLNTLIVDERNEIASKGENFSFQLGDFSDVITGSKKKFAFEKGVRSMNPDIIVTDELYTYEDFLAIEEVLSCGVKVLATLHADSVSDLINKKELRSIIESKQFKRFMHIDNATKIGNLVMVYDENLEEVGVGNK